MKTGISTMDKFKCWMLFLALLVVVVGFSTACYVGIFLLAKAIVGK